MLQFSQFSGWAGWVPLLSEVALAWDSDEILRPGIDPIPEIMTLQMDPKNSPKKGPFSGSPGPPLRRAKKGPKKAHFGPPRGVPRDAEKPEKSDTFFVDFGHHQEDYFEELSIS